jgi:hypothetical protein
MTAPFRIEQPPIVRGPGEANEEIRQYLERLLKMIPAEVVGLYVIGNGFIPQDKALGSALWCVFCFLMVFVVRVYGTRDPKQKKRAQPIPVLVSAVAFVIWVYSLGGPFTKYNIYYPSVGSLAVLVWSFLIPIFYKGDRLAWPF